MRRAAGGLHLVEVLVLAVLHQEQADAFAVVGDGEIDLLGAAGGHRHELAGDVDLVGEHVRDARVGGLDDVLDLGRIVEDRLGEEMPHVDVVADELAGLVLEVPGRIGAAGADDDVAAVEDGLQPVRSCAAAVARHGDRGDRRHDAKSEFHASLPR